MCWLYNHFWHECVLGVLKCLIFMSILKLLAKIMHQWLMLMLSSLLYTTYNFIVHVYIAERLRYTRTERLLYHIQVYCASHAGIYLSCLASSQSHITQNINSLESVQRRAAHWTSNSKWNAISYALLEQIVWLLHPGVSHTGLPSNNTIIITLSVMHMIAYTTNSLPFHNNYLWSKWLAN